MIEYDVVIKSSIKMDLCYEACFTMCECKRPILLKKISFQMKQAFFAPFGKSFDLVFENIHVVAKVREVEGGKKFSSYVQTSINICMNFDFVSRLVHIYNLNQLIKLNEVKSH